MRAVYLYFVFVCLFLCGGHGHTFAIDHHSILSNSSIHNPNHQKLIIADHSNAVVKQGAVSQGEEFLLTDDKEDDDVFSSRRYVLLANYFFALSFIFVLGYRYSRSKQRIFPQTDLSYTAAGKYLAYGALRI